MFVVRGVLFVESRGLLEVYFDLGLVDAGFVWYSGVWLVNVDFALMNPLSTLRLIFFHVGGEGARNNNDRNVGLSRNSQIIVPKSQHFPGGPAEKFGKPSWLKVNSTL